MMRTLILLLAFVPMLLRAQIEQINYAISGNIAYVASSANISGSIGIASTYDGYPVTVIGTNAFLNNTNLQTVAIPDTVTNIEDGAFEGCENLGIDDIGANIISIGLNAFAGTGISNLVMSDSVQTIGEGAFDGCGKLSVVVFGSGLTSIGDYAFAYTALAGVAIPDNVTSIGNGAFYGNKLMTSAGFGAGLTSIPNDAFAYTGLTGVVIPPNITSIGNQAFEDCGNLAYVLSYGAVTYIGPEAFLDDSSLKSIGVDSDSPAYSSFEGVLYDKNFDTLVAYPIALTNDIYGVLESVTNIADGAFEDCPFLVRVGLPGGLTSIGNSAFSGCSALISVTIPDGVTSISYAAFQNCVDLTNVVMGIDVTNIGDFAFDFDGALRSFTIPNSVGNIGINAFQGTGLISIAIPGNVGSIGIGAFDYCYGLTNAVMVGSDVSSEDAIYMSIGDDAFQEDSGLTSISIPNNVYSIGDGAFEDCSLTNLVIVPPDSCLPATFLTIGDDAFSGNSGLTSVTIPDNVTSIGNGAFEDCTSLTNLIISSSSPCIASLGFFSVSIGDNAFEGDSGLASLAVPASVGSIGYGAFEDCSSLNNLIFLGDSPALADNNEFIDDGVAASLVYYFSGTTGWSSTYGGLPTVMLPKGPQIASSSLGVQSGAFSFVINGPVSQTIVIDASTNLIDWQPVWTNTFTGATTFTDPQSTSYPERFYRVQ